LPQGQTATDWRNATEEIKDRLSVREVMESEGWHIRQRGRRADCGLCGGKEDVAIKREVWHCHRCKEGGTVFDLIMETHGVKFPEALKRLAFMARVELPTKMTAEERRRLRQQQAEQERRTKAAVKLEGAERDLCLRYRDLIHLCEKKQAEVSRRLEELHFGGSERWRGEYDGCWGWLRALRGLLRDYLAAYSLLTFAPALERARFALSPQMRQQMIDRIRWAGGCFDDEGRWMEVLE